MNSEHNSDVNSGDKPQNLAPSTMNRLPSKDSRSNIYHAALSRIQSRKKEWIKLNVVIKGWCENVQSLISWNEINHGEMNLLVHSNDTVEEICHRLESEWCLNHGFLFNSFLSSNGSGNDGTERLEVLELSPANPASNVLPPQLLPLEENANQRLAKAKKSPEPELHIIPLNLPRISVTMPNPMHSSDSESSYSSNSNESDKEGNSESFNQCEESIPLICGILYHQGKPLDFKDPISSLLPNVELNAITMIPKLEITNHFNLKEYFNKTYQNGELGLNALLVTRYDDFIQFTEFCIEEKCLEMLTFWLELEAFKSNRDNKSLMEGSWYLYCTYIDDQAPLRVILPEEITQELFTHFDDETVELNHAMDPNALKSQFDLIHHFIEMELVHRVYTRFKLIKSAVHLAQRESTNLWDYYHPNEDLTSIFPIPSLSNFTFPCLYPDSLLGSILSQFVNPPPTIENYLPLYAPIQHMKRQRVIEKFHKFFHHYHSEFYWRPDQMTTKSKRKLHSTRSADFLRDKSSLPSYNHPLPALITGSGHPLSRNVTESTDTISIESPPPQPMAYTDLMKEFQSQESLSIKGARRATLSHLDRTHDWLGPVANLEFRLLHPVSRFSNSTLHSDEHSLQSAKPQEKNRLRNRLTQIWKNQYLVKRRCSAPSTIISENTDHLNRSKLYLRGNSEDSILPLYSKENLISTSSSLGSSEYNNMNEDMGLINSYDHRESMGQLRPSKDFPNHIEREGIPRELFRVADTSSLYFSEGVPFLETSRLSINSYQRQSMRDNGLQTADYSDVLNQLESTLNKTKPRTPYIPPHRHANSASKVSAVEKASKLKKLFGELPPPELVRTLTEGKISSSLFDRNSIVSNTSPAPSIASVKRFSLQSVISQHFTFATGREDSTSETSAPRVRQIPVHWVRGKQWMVNSDVSDPELLAHAVFRRRVGKLKTILGDELECESATQGLTNDFTKGTREPGASIFKKTKNRFTQFIPNGRDFNRSNSGKGYRMSSVDSLY